MAYFVLTKPRIIVLLLVTTVPAMILAAGDVPPLLLMFNTLLGGSLSAGGANAVNCYVDRDIDLEMERTRNRPIPAGLVSPGGALAFGLTLGIGGFAYLVATVNLLTALLATGALGFYVIVYTLLLKRYTSLNIVIGGAAGAVPVLCGWSAIHNSLGLPALLLFVLVFLWTPPHFWALAIKFRNDYEAASVPMLPVVKGTERTSRSILLYLWPMFAASVVLVPLAGMGWLYLVAAVVLGSIFVIKAFHLKREPSVEAAMGLFKYSIVYLFMLFLAIALDVIIRRPGF